MPATTTTPRRPTLAELFINHVHSLPERASSQTLYFEHMQRVAPICRTADLDTSELHTLLRLQYEGVATEREADLVQAGLVCPESGTLTDLGGHTAFYLEHPMNGDTVHELDPVVEALARMPAREFKL